MADANELLSLIKQAANDSVEAGKPSGVFFGKVVSEDPLKISVDQRMELSENQLVLSRNVTDFEMEISLLSSNGWKTEAHTHTHNHTISDTYTGGGNCDNHTHTHTHDINMEKKKVTIHNALKADDLVILIRQQGGQKFIVLDRIGG